MSDYMFMLESHLSADQFRVVGEIQALAAAAGASLFLTGGALRDMLGGFPVRDLDFTVEGGGLKLARAAEQKYGAEIVSTDELRKSAELRFPSGVTAEVGTAHSERFPKSGAKPQVTAATIHEDLRARDFTINAIALSLNKASLGLLIDPTNGAGDIERKELRAIHNYSFYDDPARMLRMIRFKVRLGYSIDERTGLQSENAREADMLTRIVAGSSGRGASPYRPGAQSGRPGARAGGESAAEFVFVRAFRSGGQCGGLRQTSKGAPDGAFRMGSSRELPASVPVGAAGKAQRQGAAGADRGRGIDQGRSRRVAKTRSGGEEAGSGFEESQAAKAVAAL